MEDKRQRENASLICRLAYLLDIKIPYKYRQNDNRYKLTYKKIEFYIQIRKINKIYFCDIYTERTFKHNIFAENKVALINKMAVYMQKLIKELKRHKEICTF